MSIAGGALPMQVKLDQAASLLLPDFAGMKIMLDLIPNHTSRNHTWFKASAKRDGKFTDYYVWAGTDQSQPPSDLVSLGLFFLWLGCER